MQKIILDTIEEFDKKFHILKYEQDGEQHEGFRASKVPNSKDVKDFLKQALTNAFEAGQKSREKEILNNWKVKEAKNFLIGNYGSGDVFRFKGVASIIHCQKIIPVELIIKPIKESLSLTKESK